MRHILSILLILVSVQMSFGQTPHSPSTPAQTASSTGESEKAAKQEYIAQLFQRIQELKAANQYDEALWKEYIGLTEEEAPPISHLDQGGSTCETATEIPWLPCGDMGTLDPDGNDDCPGRPYQDVFYRYTAVENGIHLFHMCDAQSAGDTYIRVWLDGTCCSGSYVTADDNCYGEGLDGMVWLNLTVGQTIYIECGYYYTTGGTTYALWGQGPGFDCWNPIPISLPADIPYSNTNTTCGKINYYTETCLGNYDEGQDILYQLNVTTSGVFVDIALTSDASWVGMCIDENCPPDVTCINMCTSAGSSCSMPGVFLSTGTYYLMIDTWPAPDCIPQFTLSITPACPQLSGPLWGTLASQLYCVVGDIWVNSGDLLTLQPGTTFRFDGPYSLKIYGTLSAIGTASDSIVFTTDQTGENRWRGLRFDGTASSGSQLAYCLIEKGYAIASYPPEGCGGGVYCYSSSASFTNCTISDNEANWGGGAFCDQNPAPSFTGCRFSDNSATAEGGGIYCFYSSPSLTNCSMSGNSAGWGGGGAYCFFYTSPTFTNCLITGNSASWAGGVHCGPFSSPSFTNCTVSGNVATWGGGVLCDSCSTPIITSMVIAFSTGSGIGFYRSPGSQIAFCDLYGNSDGNIKFENNDPSNGPAGIGQLTTTNANGDPCDAYSNIFLDPLFVNRPGGDFHLTDNSHCIGAGSPFAFALEDFEGDPRPSPPPSYPDIGADENPLGVPGGAITPVSDLVIRPDFPGSGNMILYWSPVTGASYYNIYGAQAPYVVGTLLATGVIGTTWTDINTSSRPSPYFYFVKAWQEEP